MKPTVKIVLNYDTTAKRDAAKNALIDLIPDGVLYASISVAAHDPSVNPDLPSLAIWVNGVSALDAPDVVALTDAAENQLADATTGSRVWAYHAAETADEKNVFVSRRLKRGRSVVDD